MKGKRKKADLQKCQLLTRRSAAFVKKKRLNGDTEEGITPATEREREGKKKGESEEEGEVSRESCDTVAVGKHLRKISVQTSRPPFNPTSSSSNGETKHSAQRDVTRNGKAD